MFTGIVAGQGEVVSFDERGSSLRRPASPRLMGDSVAIDGVCLTVVEDAGSTLAFDVVPETTSRSTLASLKLGGG